MRQIYRGRDMDGFSSQSDAHRNEKVLRSDILEAIYRGEEKILIRC